MSHNHFVKTIIAGVLLSGGIAVAGLGLAAGTAQAEPGFAPPFSGPLGTAQAQPRFVPLINGPLSDGGPWTWCPGQPMDEGLDIRSGRGGPGPEVQWDMTRCHTWYGVRWGYGNVYPGVWDGTDPPPPSEALQAGPCGFPFMCSGTP
jgi:hypothetical protein